MIVLPLSLILVCALGYVVLINPDNPLTRRFQRKLSEIDSRILFGPYPVENDFRMLKGHGVTLIVSLLDPAIPYERTLMEKEKVLANAYGMRVEDYPMSSILGRKFGSHYEPNAARAAEAIAGTSENVYFHCYLGLHRIQSVKDLLTAKGIGSAQYLIRQVEREKSRLLLDAAEAAYNDQRYAEVLTALAQIKPQDRSTAARMLEAWTDYRLLQFEQSANLFSRLISEAPNNVEAHLGGGYSELRRGQLPAATAHFADALKLAPENAEALGGLGLAQYQGGLLDAASTNIERSLQLAPDNSELRDVLRRIRGGRNP